MITAAQTFSHAVLNSYAQVCFSQNKGVAFVMLCATFVKWDLGLWGLVGVIISTTFAWVFRFDRTLLKQGIFGYNTLLMSMSMAFYFAYTPAFLALFPALCLLTLLLTAGALTWLGRLGLPFLSIPFLLSLWLFLPAVRQFDALRADEGAIFLLNDLYRLGGVEMLSWYERFQLIRFPNFLQGYFQTLSAALFQYGWLGGALFSVAMLLGSRIVFVLSWLGYSLGYGFCILMFGDAPPAFLAPFAFNFIFIAIAVGGFFFVPSWKSFAAVVLLIPVIGLLSSAFTALLHGSYLPSYSLPFVFILLLILYITPLLQGRHLNRVVYQQYSPEKNLYAFNNYLSRFAGKTYYKVGLPFFGDWRVSQAHDGALTHRGEWRHAWDFDIVDKDGSTYRGAGTALEDFYCYNLPVLAPAAGYVVEILDGVADNLIGEVNLQDNWGNSVVIKHAEYLYSKLSHLKAGTFKVKVGDYVQKGDVIANLGSSGRSPEPHLHHQIQATPYIGSKTLQYPLSDYLSKKADGAGFIESGYPTEGEMISNIKTNALLKKALLFTPGKALAWEVTNHRGKTERVVWECHASPYNETYLYCPKTGAVAYYVNDGTLFYFTSFFGSRKSLLYVFYLAAHKLLLGFQTGLTVHDFIPLHEVRTGIRRWLTDIVAPFVMIQKAEYQMLCAAIDDPMRSQSIQLAAKVSLKTLGIKRNIMTAELFLEKQRLNHWTVTQGRRSLQIQQIQIAEDYTLGSGSYRALDKAPQTHLETSSDKKASSVSTL